MIPDAPPIPFHQTLRDGRRTLAHVAGFSFVINFLALVVPVYMIQVFDRVLTSRSGDTLIVLTIGAIVAFLVLAALDLVRSRLLVRLGRLLDARLAGPLARALANPSASRRDPARLRDLEVLRGFLSGPAMTALLDAPWVPLFVGLIALLHPALGGVALLGALALFGLAWLNARLSGRALDAARGDGLRSRDLAAALNRSAESGSVPGLAIGLADRWATANGAALSGQAEAADRAGTVMAASRFVRLSLQVGMLGLAAWLVIGGALTPGAMIAASIILARALAPVEQAIGLWRQVAAAVEAYKRLRDVAIDARDTGNRMQLPAPTGDLRLNRVACFPAGADAPIFAGITLSVRPGQVLGLTGPSGSGKTALGRIMLGLDSPHQGSARLDGADMRTWSTAADRQHLGYMPQQGELYPGSLRDNIARFTGATPEAVIAAAEAAGVHGRILALPEGYDTLVESGAAPLAAGLRQGILLARALFGDPQLVVLDEPYSTMDGDGVDALIRALTLLRARRAVVIVIAHRPSLLARCDRILTLRDGTARLTERRDRPDLRLMTQNGAQVAAGGQ